AGADRGRTIAAAGAHRSDAIGELDFADGPERLRSVSAIHRAAIDIDGRNDVVAGRDVFSHLLDQIALAAAIPQMVMRVDNRSRWIENFLLPQCQPVFARIG